MNHNHICLLQFPTHTVRVNQSQDGRIHCFKYDRTACDMAVFEESDQDSASDYILESLPNIRYYISWSGDNIED
jgi:hypothetical protein